MAARFHVIILEQIGGDPRQFRYALWADVPAARQAFYSRPGASSAWVNATASDTQQLITGAVVERVDVLNATGLNLAGAQAVLQATWTDYQSAVSTTNPWARYGTTWDGATWVNNGVA